LDFIIPDKLKILLLSFSLLLVLGSTTGNGQQTDDEQRLRELFLKSRQKMEVVPSPTPTPRPTPAPAESPSKQSVATPPEPAASKTPFPHPTPPTRPSATPLQRETPATTATPVPSSTPDEQQSVAEETPSSTPKKKKGWFFFGKRDDDGDSIVVQKSGAQGDLVPAPNRGGRWEFLTPAIRQAIDEARVARNRWKYIIVHNSGTRQGNARIFDYYHRHVRKMPNGLAYHFVIGNGSSSGNGQIEIGDRWTRQLNGGHVHSDYLNYISLGICLVGDFNRDVPTKNQYLALDELIRYLRQRVGKVDSRYSIVRGHKEINPRPTDCPGARFPLTWLHRTFPD
jgi:hypothetical protein